jgi:hypothetical protein
MAKKLADLSIEELEAHKLALHDQEDAIREQLREAEGVLRGKRAAVALEAMGFATGSVLIAPSELVLGVTPGDAS